MSQSRTPPLGGGNPLGELVQTCQFDAGQLTSDGGLAWVQQADVALGLCAALAAQVPEWRRGPVRHSRETLVRQRVYQIVCGYEDQDDADTLRTDPLLKLVCGRIPGPEPTADLASQPTLSRLENAVNARACYRLAEALLDVYLAARERQAGIPTHLLLDLDGTDDPTHGNQEGSAYHGYYQQHMFHPLLIFDGETDQLLTAVLRPGTVHASRGVVAVLRRLVQRLRARWPQVRLEIRADSGFAVPALYEWCEGEGIGYTLGLATNARLTELAAPLREQAEQERERTGQKVRLADATTYAAGTWSHPRRVVFKAEALEQGPNVRFIVTTRSDVPLALYNWYVQRGTPEQWIDDLKGACFADRLSCHRFWANQFRLLLHAAAYWLLDTLRRWLRGCGIAPLRLDTLRLRLIKIGGWVRQHTAGFRLHLASSHSAEPLWQLLTAGRSPTP